MTKWLYPILFVLLSTPLWGQGGTFPGVADKNSNGTRVLVPFATITVCADTATGAPCTPTSTIYTNKTLTVTTANPFLADANGNFQFYAVPGFYQYCVSGTGVVASCQIVVVPMDSAAINGAAYANRFATLQLAINSVAGNGRVYAPCATYSSATEFQVPAPADVSITKSVVLTGYSPWCTTLQPTAGSINILHPLVNAVIENVNLQPNAQTGITGVYLFSSPQVHLHDFRIGAVNFGLQLHGDGVQAAGTFNETIGPGLITGPAYGIYMDTANFSGIPWVQGNDIYSVKVTGATTEGVFMSNTGETNFFGGDVESNTHGLRYDAGGGELHLFGTHFDTPNFDNFLCQACTSGTFIVSNGWNAWAQPVSTTGSITSGTPTLTVASAAGIQNHKLLRISGAGVAAADLIAEVTNVSGVTITLATNASTTVTGTNCASNSTGCVTGPVVSDTGSTFVMGESLLRLLGSLDLQRVNIGIGIPNPEFNTRIYGGYQLWPGYGNKQTFFLTDLGAGSPITDWRFRDTSQNTIVDVDFINKRLGVGATAPSFPLDVTGPSGILGRFYVTGATSDVCYNAKNNTSGVSLILGNIASGANGCNVTGTVNNQTNLFTNATAGIALISSVASTSIDFYAGNSGTTKNLSVTGTGVNVPGNNVLTVGAAQDTTAGIAFEGGAGLTGTAQGGLFGGPTCTSAATVLCYGVVGAPATAAAAFTASIVASLYGQAVGKGAGSTITKAVSVYCENQTAGASNFCIDGSATTNPSQFGGIFSLYNNELTAGRGIPYTRGLTSQRSETGADANLLTITPASVAGTYRGCITMEVSAQNTATLGWTMTWTDSNGSAQAPTNLALTQTGVAAPALTFTAATNGNYNACNNVSVNNAGTNIVVKTTFSGTSIAYKATAWIERLN